MTYLELHISGRLALFNAEGRSIFAVIDNYELKMNKRILSGSQILFSPEEYLIVDETVEEVHRLLIGAKIPQLATKTDVN